MIPALFPQASFQTRADYIFTTRNRLKQRGRQRQRERHKTMGLMSKNNRSARAFYILVHFFAVLCKTTTSNDQILGFLENVSP